MSQTYHSAVGHGALGFAGTLGALPPLWLSVRRLADLEDIPGGSGAVFAPIRCRTHAYTSTNKTALTRNASLPCTPPQNSATFPSLPAPPTCACTTVCRILSRPPTRRRRRLHRRHHLLSLRSNSPSPTAGSLESRFPEIALPISPRFLPSSVGDGADIIPDEAQSAGKVPDERLRLLSALPRLRRGASHLHSQAAALRRTLHAQKQESS